MAWTPNAQRELEDAVAAIVDETLSSSQRVRLQELLRGEKEASACYVRAMAFHAGLFGHASEGVEEPSLLRAGAIGLVVRKLARPTPLSLTLATLVIGLVVTSLALWAVPVYRMHESAAVRGAGVSEGVARVSRVRDVEWGTGERRWFPGASLNAGQRLDLRRGLVELAFSSGATVVVEGPAVVVVSDANAASLDDGTVRAHVPKEAVGFRLATPLMEIVDLGTAFGVRVDSQVASEVHVFQGSVAVSPTGRDPTSDGFVLGAGQGWKVSADHQAGHMVASDPRRFPKVDDSEVVVLQEGGEDAAGAGPFAGVDDTQILEWAPTGNFGGRGDFDVGQLRGERASALVRFDLTPLQGKVDRLLSVTLRLTPNREASYFPWAESGTIALHRVSDQCHGWVEGQRFTSGLPLLQGEVTWSELGHGRMPWPGKPGASALGIDIDARPLVTVSYTPDTDKALAFHMSGDLSYIQNWIDGTANAGLLLRETSGGRENRINFHSSESASVASRPALVVRYLPVQQPSNQSIQGVSEGKGEQ